MRGIACGLRFNWHGASFACCARLNHIAVPAAYGDAARRAADRKLAAAPKLDAAGLDQRLFRRLPLRSGRPRRSWRLLLRWGCGTADPECHQDKSCESSVAHKSQSVVIPLSTSTFFE